MMREIYYWWWLKEQLLEFQRNFILSITPATKEEFSLLHAKLRLERLLAMSPVKLDIGCGLHPMGHDPSQREDINSWIHCDWNDGSHIELVCNFAEIPLEPGIVDRIHIGDVIEHVQLFDYDKVFGHWNAIAKIGCRLTGATPNGPRIMRDFVAGRKSFRQAVQPHLYGWQDRPGEQHFTIFSEETLIETLNKYGFEKVDFSGSPIFPPVEDGYGWLVFSAEKVRNLT